MLTFRYLEVPALELVELKLSQTLRVGVEDFD
jgi:hypothetical protein